MEDETGFRDFVRSRLPALSRSAYLLTGDHDQAQDLVQVALIRVARHWTRLIRSGDPTAYLRRTMYHEHVTRWRRRRTEVPLAAIADPTSSRDESAEVDQRLAVHTALRRLTPRQRAVLVLRYLEDLSEADTAAVLACSIGTPKGR